MESLRGLKRLSKANARQHRNHQKKYEAYRLLRKHERSHIERILKHMKKYKDNSPMVEKALKKYRELIVQHK